MAKDLFAKAKDTKAPKKTKGKVKPEVAVEDLHTYAALVAAEKTIKTMVDTLKGAVNEEALEAFLRRQSKDSLQGVDGDTTASLQLRKRTSRSALSDQEVTVLEDAGVDIQKSADSKFYVDAKYADDPELLGKVSEALDGIVPEDFFGHTGDKFIVGDDAINQALKIEDESDRRSVVKIVATQAARTKFGGSHEDMLEILDEVLKG